MSAPKKSFSVIFEKPLFWVVAVAVLMAIPLYKSFTSPQVEAPPVLSHISNFHLVNQNGEKVAYDTHYKGSVLVVNFVFTTCPDICPLLSQQMSKIQDRIVGNAPIIRLVSISVDPATDTPERLKAYADKYHANPRVWSFLTGDLMQIYDVVVKGFKVAMENPGAKPEPGTVETDPKTQDPDDVAIDLMNITHGEHFVIVDQLGRIRAYKHARNDQEINEIITTVSLLANQNPNNAPAGEAPAGEAPAGEAPAGEAPAP